MEACLENARSSVISRKFLVSVYNLNEKIFQWEVITVFLFNKM